MTEPNGRRRRGEPWPCSRVSAGGRRPPPAGRTAFLLAQRHVQLVLVAGPTVAVAGWPGGRAGPARVRLEPGSGVTAAGPNPPRGPRTGPPEFTVDPPPTPPATQPLPAQPLKFLSSENVTASNFQLLI